MFDPRRDAIAFFDAHLWQALGYTSHADNPKQMRFVTAKERENAKKDQRQPIAQHWGIGRGTKMASGMLMAATRDHAILIAGESYQPEPNASADVHCLAPGESRAALFAQWLRDTPAGESIMLATDDKKPDTFLRLSYPRQAVLAKPNEPIAFDWLAFKQAAQAIEDAGLAWKDCKTAQRERDQGKIDALRKRLAKQPSLRLALTLPHYASGTGRLLSWLGI